MRATEAFVKAKPKHTGDILHDIEVGKNLKWNKTKTPPSQGLPPTINKWDHMEIQTFWTAKAISRINRQSTERLGIFTGYNSDK